MEVSSLTLPEALARAVEAELELEAAWAEHKAPAVSLWGGSAVQVLPGGTGRGGPSPSAQRAQSGDSDQPGEGKAPEEPDSGALEPGG